MWISTKERLPEVDQWVLIHTWTGRIEVRTFQMQEAMVAGSRQIVRMPTFAGLGAGDSPLENVSHWMPLPAAPSE